MALAGCGASASRGAAAAVKPSRSAIGAPSCAVRNLRLSLTDPISPATDEGGREFALLNTSHRPCVVSVSPARIALYDDGRRLPFTYAYKIPRGGGLEVPAQRLRPALLLPATAGYFSATKQECVGKTSGVATELRVFLRGSPTPLTITLPANGGGHGVSAIGYCAAAETGEQHPTPGNHVRVSPIQRRPPASESRRRTALTIRPSGGQSRSGCVGDPDVCARIATGLRDQLAFALLDRLPR